MNLLEILLLEGANWESGEELYKAIERGRVSGISKKRFFGKNFNDKERAIDAFDKMIKKLNIAGIDKTNRNSYILVLLKKAKSLESLIDNFINQNTDTVLDPIRAYFGNKNKQEAINDEEVKAKFDAFIEAPFNENKDKEFEEYVNKKFEEKARANQDELNIQKFGDWEVWRPKDFAEAKASACMNNRKSKWCTAANSRYFKMYSDEGQLVAIRNPKKNVMFQMNFNNKSSKEGEPATSINFKNERDAAASIEELMGHNPPDELLKSIKDKNNKTSLYDIISKEEDNNPDGKNIGELPSGRKIVKVEATVDKGTIEGKMNPRTAETYRIGDIELNWQNFTKNGQEISTEEKGDLLLDLSKFFTKKSNKFEGYDVKPLTKKMIKERNLAEKFGIFTARGALESLEKGEDAGFGIITIRGQDLLLWNKGIITDPYSRRNSITANIIKSTFDLPDERMPSVKGWDTRRININELNEIIDHHDKKYEYINGTIFHLSKGNNKYVIKFGKDYDDGTDSETSSRVYKITGNRISEAKPESVIKLIEQDKFPKELQGKLFSKSIPALETAAKELTNKTANKKNEPPFSEKKFFLPGIPNLGTLGSHFSSNKGPGSNYLEIMKKTLSDLKKSGREILGIVKMPGSVTSLIIIKNANGTYSTQKVGAGKEQSTYPELLYKSEDDRNNRIFGNMYERLKVLNMPAVNKILEKLPEGRPKRQ